MNLIIERFASKGTKAIDEGVLIYKGDKIGKMNKNKNEYSCYFKSPFDLYVKRTKKSSPQLSHGAVYFDEVDKSFSFGVNEYSTPLNMDTELQKQEGINVLFENKKLTVTFTKDYPNGDENQTSPLYILKANSKLELKFDN